MGDSLGAVIIQNDLGALVKVQHNVVQHDFPKRVGHLHGAAGGQVAAGVRQGQGGLTAVQPSDDALAVHGGNALVPGLPGPVVGIHRSLDRGV